MGVHRPAIPERPSDIWQDRVAQFRGSQLWNNVATICDDGPSQISMKEVCFFKVRLHQIRI
jgi:hypothetical protein